MKLELPSPPLYSCIFCICKLGTKHLPFDNAPIATSDIVFVSGQHIEDVVHRHVLTLVVDARTFVDVRAGVRRVEDLTGERISERSAAKMSEIQGCFGTQRPSVSSLTLNYWRRRPT